MNLNVPLKLNKLRTPPGRDVLDPRLQILVVHAPLIDGQTRVRFLKVAELGGGDLDGASYCKIHSEVSS